MKEKWFNHRPICLVFAFLLLGSVFAFYITRYIAITITSTAIVAILLLIPAIIKKKLKYLIVPIVSFGLGIGLYYIAVGSFNNKIDYTPTTIQARIYNVSNEENGMIKVEADSCIFDGKKVNDNITLFVYDNDSLFENIEVGNIIKFSPYKFYESDLFYNSIPNASLYSEDLKYTASVLIDNIEYIKTDKTLAETIKDKVKNNLTLGLTNENAEIAYSALFGDKDLLSDKQYSAYKMSGIAHLLAVSGLHVGIISALLCKILDWCKIKKWYKFAIVGLFLFFYAYICNFTISVVRAMIMSLVLLLADIFGREYDSLTSISIAGIVIFLINPLCVFDVGFLLSFSCVLGISMLYKPIRVALRKMFAPKKVAEGFAISLSTTISIVFIMAFFFKNLNFVSVIANVILIPIFTVAFYVIFIVSILSIPFSFVAHVLYPINYVLDFINLSATILGNLPIANFSTSVISYTNILLYFALLFFLSRFNVAKHKYKLISTLPMVALMFYCLI